MTSRVRDQFVLAGRETFDLWFVGLKIDLKEYYNI